MSNSPLVDYVQISPNKSTPRNHKIDTITIHCVVGQCTVEGLGCLFSSSFREASSNYGIGYDGRIGMYVEEKDRSWCSSSSSNDNRAITIEVASDTTEPYEITDRAMKSLIKLVADVCKRNGIKELKWKADKSLIGQVDKQNMTVHRWFANKSCPGEYLYSRHSYIANEVNKILGSNTTSEPVGLASGAKLALNNADLYISSVTTKSSGKISGTYYIWNGEVIKNRIRITNSESNVGKAGQITGWIDYSIAKNSSAPASSSTFKSYTVRVTANALNIRKGPGINYGTNGIITDKGVYTIVEEKTGTGSTKGWGKLKSGAGWISLDYTTKY